MKVCFISGEYPPMQGGVADHTQRLMDALKGLGVDSCILTSVKARSEADDASVFPDIERWGFPSWAKVERVLRKTSSDLAHIQYQTAAYGMQPAINFLPFWLHHRLPGCPIVTTFHDLRVPYLFPKAGRLRRWVNYALLRGSDGVVVTNEEDYAAVIEMGRSTSGLHLIPIGNNLPPALPESYDRASWRAHHKVEANDILVSYFGLLNSSKGVEILLAALRQLLESIPGIKLLMVGGSVGDSDPTNVAYQQQILKIIDELDLGTAVIWTGYASPSDVSAYLTASDVCVLPFKDGASFRRTSLLTALAHGLPTVTTKVAVEAPHGTLPRLVHGENCLFVPPGDEQALAEAIRLLVDSHQLRTRLAEGGLQLSKAFSWERIAQQTVDMYHSVLKRGGSPC